MCFPSPKPNLIGLLFMALANVGGAEGITCIHGDDLLVLSHLKLPKFEPPKLESVTFTPFLNYGVLCSYTKLFLY